MLNWFRRQKAASLEEQLKRLEEVGISLKNQILLDLSRSEYEERPYIQLLISMGSEVYLEDETVYPSDQVWCFDRECIEDKGDYVRVIERIAELIKTEVLVTDICDFVDIDSRRAWVSFKADSHVYKYELHVQDDWLDLNVFQYFSRLLADKGSRYRFYYSDIGQSILVVLIKKDHMDGLNKILNIFIPAYRGEGNPVI